MKKEFINDLERILKDETTIEEVVEKVERFAEKLEQTIYEKQDIQISNDQLVTIMMMHDFITEMAPEKLQTRAILFAAARAAIEFNKD